jgi:hypothetical protein
MTNFATIDSRLKLQDSRDATIGKSQSRRRQQPWTGCVDGIMAFVICSRHWRDAATAAGRTMMMTLSSKTLVVAAALAALTTSALADAAAPTPWVLAPDMGYGYGKDGKTFSYKMGTNNAGLLLKGAKKVPKGTLFFIGQNGQLYMRTGSYLEGDGSFMFGPDQ